MITVCPLCDVPHNPKQIIRSGQTNWLFTYSNLNPVSTVPQGWNTYCSILITLQNPHILQYPNNISKSVSKTLSLLSSLLICCTIIFWSSTMEAYINLGRFQAQEVKLACHYYSSAITDMALFPLFLHLSFPTILVSCFIVESFNFFD